MEGKVKSKIGDSMKILFHDLSCKHWKNALQQKETLYTLNSIHNEFAATQIDKANSNVEFICQWFYILVLIKEFGLHQNITSENNTFK